jgi:hypothetical protein
MTVIDLPSPLSEESRREQWVLQVGIKVPHKQENKATKANNHWRNYLSTSPREATAAKVQADEEQGAPGDEEKKTDIVHLLHQRQAGDAVGLVLRLKRWWTVKAEEKDAGAPMEGTHVPVGASPGDGGVGDEQVCDEWCKDAHDGAGTVEAFDAERGSAKT